MPRIRIINFAFPSAGYCSFLCYQMQEPQWGSCTFFCHPIPTWLLAPVKCIFSGFKWKLKSNYSATLECWPQILLSDWIVKPKQCQNLSNFLLKFNFKEEVLSIPINWAKFSQIKQLIMSSTCTLMISRSIHLITFAEPLSVYPTFRFHNHQPDRVRIIQCRI